MLFPSLIDIHVVIFKHIVVPFHIFPFLCANIMITQYSFNPYILLTCLVYNLAYRMPLLYPSACWKGTIATPLYPKHWCPREGSWYRWWYDGWGTWHMEHLKLFRMWNTIFKGMDLESVLEPQFLFVLISQHHVQIIPIFQKVGIWLIIHMGYKQISSLNK